MLPLSKCRELLDNESREFSDEEITELRDNFYQIADIIVDTYQDCSKPYSFEKFIQFIDKESVIKVEERAAIYEFEDGFNRIKAEKMALNEFWKENSHEA